MMAFKQSQFNLDEKNIYSSGCIINCPFYQGKPNIIQNLLIQIIQHYLVNMIIVIDLPDTYRELD